MLDMKLLLDHNLSFRLLNRLSEKFTNSSHVYHLNLSNASDIAIWNYAKSNEFTIVTKDTDFFDLVSLKGFPPKVIWIKKGNCTTEEIGGILENSCDKMMSFIEDDTNGILILN